VRHTLRLPNDLSDRLLDFSARKGVSQTLVVEAALQSYFSPDSADRLEGALSKRLDRMTRHLERIENQLALSNEALAVFVRFWVAATPVLPDASEIAAQAKGRERYRSFLEILGRRIAARRSLADEISREIASRDDTTN
jgi:hypothetical protein